MTGYTVPTCVLCARTHTQMRDTTAGPVCRNDQVCRRMTFLGLRIGARIKPANRESRKEQQR